MPHGRWRWSRRCCSFISQAWRRWSPRVASRPAPSPGRRASASTFSWRIDGLSLTFALLISGIGTLIVLYSGAYLAGHERQGRFFAFILMFMGAMQGLVLADGFVTLFVFWEATSITSFLLIGFDNHREAARRAAFQALVVTGMGGLSLLAGLLVIWQVTGAADMSSLLGKGDVIRSSPFYLAALVLVLGGAFTKSAQFPLHFWLPNAMQAPTPVSAYLHSATMVKAGIYLLMRLNPAIGGTAAWETILPLFGGDDADRRHGAGLAPDRSQADARLHHRRLARAARHADRLRFGQGDRSGGALSDRALPVQGRAVHGRRRDRP